VESPLVLLSCFSTVLFCQFCSNAMPNNGWRIKKRHFHCQNCKHFLTSACHQSSAITQLELHFSKSTFPTSALLLKCIGKLVSNSTVNNCACFWQWLIQGAFLCNWPPQKTPNFLEVTAFLSNITSEAMPIFCFGVV